jgi:hypothetical protein
MKNIYAKLSKQYLEKGYSCIPDKYGSKSPAIKGWTEYCDRLPTEEERVNWSNSFEESNLSICLGPASGIVALDLDTDKPEILDIIKHLLPDSPVEKRGSKGWTRFYRFSGDTSEMLKFNGDCILEILSENKKTTMPESMHPNGASYVFTSELSLLDIDKKDLPVLPPALISHLQLKLSSAFGDGQIDSYGKIVSGRNQNLSSTLGKLLSEPHTVEEVLGNLIEFDKTTNVPPYFTDLSEHQHAEPMTNALLFYSQHLNSFNSKRHRKNEQYVTPTMQAPEVAQPKKLELIPKEKKKKAHESIPAESVLKIILDNMNANSWVKQPELAFGAILALGATLCSRKFMFQGMSTNLYIVNIAGSGMGKDFGLQWAKNMLVNLNDNLLGAGDMASDAGITDSLPGRPVQLYPMDEIGGILKTITSGKAEYNSKMADILTELYTSSTSRYLGRALSEGVKGSVDRPHLNILGATTPTGFRQGVSKSALDKGLLGRFLVFFGDSDVPSTRIKSTKPLPVDIMNQLQWLATYTPQEGTNSIQNRQQYFTELTATDAADQMLDDIFYKLDKKRLEMQNSNISPIAARLYQQMIKLVIIHACLNSNRQVPIINVSDVDFGYNVIMAFLESFKAEVDNLIHDSPLEQQKTTILQVIRDSGGVISQSALIKKTPGMGNKFREALIDDLTKSDQIEAMRVERNKRWVFDYVLKGV